LVADGLDEGSDAEVSGSAEEAFCGADDEGEGVFGEGVVSESGAVELVEDEFFDGFGRESWEEGGVGDAGADFFVDGEGEGLHEGGLADEDEVVGAREVFEEEAEFAQAVGLHEVGVVDDGDEHFACAVESEGFLDEETFAFAVAAVELDLEGFAEDAQGVVVGVEGAVDDGGDEAFGVVGEEGVFEDAFAGSGFAEEEAEAALLGVDEEDVEDFLLVRQEGEGVGFEGVACEAEVGADHRN